MSDKKNKSAIWTPANIVTFIRICGIPLFLVVILSPWPWYSPDILTATQWKSFAAAAIFIILSATDGIDGYLARSRNEVTDFGKLLDPIADKLLVTCALVALVDLHMLPSWVVFIILAREFIVSGIRMIAASQNVIIAASIYGKVKTASQIVAITLFVIKGAFPITLYPTLYWVLYAASWIAMIFALIMTILSLFDYFNKSRHLFGFEPAASVKAQLANEPLTREQKAKISQTALKTQSVKLLESASEKGITLSVAESLTAGMVSSIIGGTPGASDLLLGSVVSYSNEAKASILHVEEEVIASHGAVSEETAIAMATGVRVLCDSDFAVSTTGIAGPTGETPGKPIGTVWIGFASAEKSYAQLFHFPGDRQEVRLQASQKALEIVQDEISALEH